MSAATSTPTAAPPLPSEVHARKAALLEKHVAYFESQGDTEQADLMRRQLSGTAARVQHDKAAEAFVAKLGLGHEVKPDAITFTDAVNFVAKVLHEVEDGVKTSHYVRTHRSVAKIEKGAHVDAKRMAATFNPADDVCEHLGLTDPAHVAAAAALFAGKVSQ